MWCVFFELNVVFSSFTCFIDQPTVNTTVIHPVLCTTHICSVREFTNVTVVCITDGNPKPNVTFKRILRGEESQEWNYLPSMETESDSIWKWYFSLTNITRNLHGMYQCDASNGVVSADLNVLILNITCKFSSWKFTKYIVSLSVSKTNIRGKNVLGRVTLTKVLVFPDFVCLSVSLSTSLTVCVVYLSMHKTVIHTITFKL